MADETREENSDLVDVSHRAAEGFFFSMVLLFIQRYVTDKMFTKWQGAH